MPSSSPQANDTISNIFLRIYLYICSQITWLLIRILRLGPIPQHVAFIMDGNRRFAQRKQANAWEGHRMGFHKLEETLEWCMHLGIKVVSVYAFSIENFNRPKKEVGTLMDLAEEKFNEFAKHSDVIQKHGIRVRLLGALDMLPPSVREAGSKAVLETRHHNNATVNICCPYTSREEITTSLKEVVDAIDADTLGVEDVSTLLLEKCLYTQDQPPVDLLVRTSGESRLSDYFLWQVVNHAMLFFLPTLWPDFTFFHMIPILLTYQAYYPIQQANRAKEFTCSQESNLCLLHSSTNAGHIESDEDDSAIDLIDERKQFNRAASFLEQLYEERVSSRRNPIQS